VTLQVFHEQIKDCQKCPLAHSRTQVVFGHGNPGRKSCASGKPQGPLKITRGKPFVGAAGKLLGRRLEEIGMHSVTSISPTSPNADRQRTATHERKRSSRASLNSSCKSNSSAQKSSVCLGISPHRSFQEPKEVSRKCAAKLFDREVIPSSPGSIRRRCLVKPSWKPSKEDFRHLREMLDRGGLLASAEATTGQPRSFNSFQS
jgi:uracil-DNA glycosylase family 4